MAGPEGREQQVRGDAQQASLFSLLCQKTHCGLISHRTSPGTIPTVCQSITGHKQTGPECETHTAAPEGTGISTRRKSRSRRVVSPSS